MPAFIYSGIIQQGRQPGHFRAIRVRVDGSGCRQREPLLANDAPAYGSGNVDLTRLANVVQAGNPGITGPGGSICFTPGSSGCYNGVITISNLPNTFFYDT